MDEIRIKKLIYQSWHRGCKETDILLGLYAKSNLEDLTDSELDLYEKFITEDDWDIYAWFVGKLESPSEYLALIEKIKQFNQSQHFLTE